MRGLRSSAAPAVGLVGALYTLVTILSGATARGEVGSAESVLPPCFIPTDVDTSGWQTIRWFGFDARKPYTLRIPKGFHRDEKAHFIEGGEIWFDGKRRLTQYSSYGSYTCVPDPRNPGCAECTDTLAGVPLRIDTTYDVQDSLYKVVAVHPADGSGPLGIFTELKGESPDSSDLRVFLSILRTIEPASAVTRSGAISGIVVHQDGTAAPQTAILIPGAQRSAMTNSAGEYAIPDVPIGGYLLEAKAYGFVPGRARAWVDPGRTTRVDLRLGPARAGGARQLEAQAQTGAISGRVVDEGGAVVPYVSVDLKGTMLGAMTSLDGNFRISQVPVGTYTVIVRSVVYATSERTDVQVSAGQTVTVEFRVKRVPVRLVGTEITGTPRARAIDDRRIPTPREDSLALFGAWRWSGSWGGELGVRATPASSGLHRLLYLRENGTYAFWERGSARDTLLCAGTFSIHRSGGHLEDGPPASLWIELKGWYFSLDARQLIAFRGRDTIMTYPGGGNMRVSDALTNAYIREAGHPEPRISQTKRQEPVPGIWIPPCPAPKIDVSSWVPVDSKKFSFLLPREFRKVEAQGIDSYVGSFEATDSCSILSFDWGQYSNPLTDYDEYEHYALCSEAIGGKPARLITAVPVGNSRNPEIKYMAGAAWRDVFPGVHLTIWGAARDRRGLERLLAILRSVRFEDE